jgi:acyl-CoA thioesterase
MWAKDQASAGLGMVLEAVTPGAARLSMRIERRMLNGYGICHGGFIFALADSAFAFACNTGGDVSVANHCSIAYLRPAREGDVLLAAAEERQREGRQGIYDVRVTCGAEIVAEFRGLSRTTGAKIEVDGDAA